MNVNFAEKFSMCCRLSLDFDFRQNSFGGGGVKIGSARIVSLNLPRIAYKSKASPPGTYLSTGADDRFIIQLNKSIDKAIQYLHAYWDIFLELIDQKVLKFYRVNWYNPSMLFLTLGFHGLPDCAEIMGYDPTSEKGVMFMQKVIDLLVLRTKMQSNGIKFNVEEVPSEAASGTMAKFNQDFGEKKKYYSNQFVPLNANISLSKRIEIEGMLQSRLTGGGMTFLNFDHKLTPTQAYELHKMLLHKHFVGQFCINYGYSSCGEHTVLGRQDKCECGKEMEFYTRVVGYLSKESNMASSKQLEVAERKYYKEVFD
jgi:ribonucleoside-triphosphate reductase